jgi:hypothetical protein
VEQRSDWWGEDHRDWRHTHLRALLPEEVTSVGNFSGAKVWQQFRYGVRDASKSRTVAQALTSKAWQQFRRGVRDASKSGVESNHEQGSQFHSGVRDASKSRTDDERKLKRKHEREVCQHFVYSVELGMLRNSEPMTQAIGRRRRKKD